MSALEKRLEDETGYGPSVTGATWSTVSDMRLGLIAGSLLSISILVTTSGPAFGAQSAVRKAVFARGFDHPTR